MAGQNEKSNPVELAARVAPSPLRLALYAKDEPASALAI
jgi:hypothetical protein